MPEIMWTRDRKAPLLSTSPSFCYRCWHFAFRDFFTHCSKYGCFFWYTDISISKLLDSSKHAFYLTAPFCGIPWAQELVFSPSKFALASHMRSFKRQLNRD